MNRFLLAALAVTLWSPSYGQDAWTSLKVPGAWESQSDGRFAELDGFAWYRCFVKVPENWQGSRLLLTLVAADDVDEAYFNGDKVGANGGMPPLFAKPSSSVRRPAVIDPDQVRFGQENLIAIRVYDHGGQGGIIKGPIQLSRVEDAIDLSGQWDFLPGDQKHYAQWPNNDPTSEAAQALIAAYKQRQGDNAAGHKGIVAADKEGRERDLAEVRKRFENNSNVHSNIEGKGDPLPPKEALAALRVGSEFELDLVLSEPEITQPLYVEFDARGRMWVTQYIQYPKPAGLEILTWDNHLRTVFDAVPPPPPYKKPEHQQYIGRDKITIHEDTDGDGTYDHHKVFLEGMNIVTSTCQDHDGVWVMNPPYLLFYADKNRDDVPDGDPEVHLSGFGLEDTHSVANSLKWGPDGWLYGATGSTVTARVRVHQKPNQSPLTFFGQTIWRYHPDAHDFELFAEGGWNTFGVDFDDAGRLYSGTNGSMQAVHFVQGGFYQKGFGKHGPHTNPFAFDYFYGVPIEGKHQRLVQQWLPWDDGQLLGVNCLANRVPVIQLEPNGSTFRSHEVAPAIESEDVWFRPVHVALGPDGAAYVSDFYDARITHVDPRDNWDRDHGRIYRLRNKGQTLDPKENLEAKSPAELLGYLKHENRWYRDTARRLVVAKNDLSVVEELRKWLARFFEVSAGAEKPWMIETAVSDRDLRESLAALWILNSMDALGDHDWWLALNHPCPEVRMWAIRLIGDRGGARSGYVLSSMLPLTKDDNLQVVSQLAASAPRIEGGLVLLELLLGLKNERFSSDPYIPSQLWWALEKEMTMNTRAVLDLVKRSPKIWTSPIFETKLGKLLARRLAADPTKANLNHAATLLESAPTRSAKRIVIEGLEEGLRGIQLTSIPNRLDAAMAKLWQDGEDDLPLVSFGLRVNSEAALEAAQHMVQDRRVATEDRMKLITTLAEQHDAKTGRLLASLASQSDQDDIRLAALNGLRRFADPALIPLIVKLTGDKQEQIRSTAISVLAGRPSSARHLLDAVDAGDCAKEHVSLENLLVIRQHQDATLNQRIDQLWGRLNQPSEVKQERVRQVTALLQGEAGDRKAGADVFTQVCASCHKIFSQGAAIGPDLTGYERSNLEFLITAIVDPNLAVREEYELTTLTLRPSEDGTENVILSGFIKALDDASITIADLTGNETVVAKHSILKQQNTPTSIMPEGLLQTLSERQIRDLFAYLQASEAPQ